MATGQFYMDRILLHEPTDQKYVDTYVKGKDKYEKKGKKVCN